MRARDSNIKEGIRFFHKICGELRIKEELMDEIRVYAPKDSNADYDYIAFSFDGKHSYEDLHIIRTSDGDRYNENLFPTLKDTAVEVPGGDGMYFLKTGKGPREFAINFAFDDLDDAKIE
jgi:hypothetical protein